MDSEFPLKLMYKTRWLMSLQAHTGFQFDQSKAEQLVIRIKRMMAEIEQEVEPKLPKKKPNKGEMGEVTMPKNPYKMDGSFSHHMLRFIEKHNAEVVSETEIKVDGKIYKVSSNAVLDIELPMRLRNQDQLKAWLIEQGWKPTLWNYKKDKAGKKVRDDKGKLIKTSPKFQENGVLCYNLELMEGDLVRSVVRWLSLRNRLGVVNGWLKNERFHFDGRLSADSTGYAASYRQKHTVVTNVPKADESVVLGHEMRDLFIPRPGHVLVGYDASALEARVEAHYCYKYRGGKAYAKTLLEDDVHMVTALSVFHDKIGHLYGTDRWNKDDPEVKPWRSKAKGIRYGISYGAGPDKIAGMLGVSKSEAEDILRRFWDSAESLALLKERLTLFWEGQGQKKFIVGLDGRKVYTRYKHALINTLFQSAGAILMDTSILFMDKWLGGIQYDDEGYPCYKYKGFNVYRCGFFHDELQWSCPLDIAEEVGTMGVRSIVKAGEYHKLNVPLAGEFNIGNSWQATH